MTVSDVASVIIALWVTLTLLLSVAGAVLAGRRTVEQVDR